MRGILKDLCRNCGKPIWFAERLRRVPGPWKMEKPNWMHGDGTSKSFGYLVCGVNKKRLLRGETMKIRTAEAAQGCIIVQGEQPYGLQTGIL